MPCRIEIYEKYAKSSDYSYDWWRENMPHGTKPPATSYGYRRTMILVEQIERPIEIVNNKKECIIKFWDGSEMVIKSNYDDFCIRLNDAEQENMIEEEMILGFLQGKVEGGLDVT